MTATACSVCQRPFKGSAIPRDPATAAKHPLWLTLNETKSHMCGTDVQLLASWDICIDCRPKVEPYLYQAIGGVLAGAARAFIAQNPLPKIKRRKR